MTDSHDILSNLSPGSDPVIPSGTRELTFAILALSASILCLNGVLGGGFSLGFSLGWTAIIVISLAYQGKRLRWSLWGSFHLVAALALGVCYAYSDDGLFKLFAFLPMTYAWFQALAQLTGSSRRNPGTLATVVDSCSVCFVESFRDMGSNLRSLSYRPGPQGVEKRKTGAVLLGLACSIPVLLIVVPFLISSDMAFEGFLDRLLFFDPAELIMSLIFGSSLFLFMFSRNLNLRRKEPVMDCSEKAYSGSASPMTLNTLLVIVSIFYVMYLVSQLAYFVSGFSGILPEGYSPAEYARRGFFEMCMVCAINLGLLALAAGLVKRKEGKLPEFTKGLCLFICLFSLFLAMTSISKMFLYIDYFGLTYLRVVTTVFDFCLIVALMSVGIWLFARRFPYMKVIAATCLLAVALVGWADVESQVARYNMKAYQSGKLESLDFGVFTGSGSSAYLVPLMNDADPVIAAEATDILMLQVWEEHTWTFQEDGTIVYALNGQDLRAWNYVKQEQLELLSSLVPQLREELLEFLNAKEGSVLTPAS